MIRLLLLVICWCGSLGVVAQPSASFTRISVEEGRGLASDVVYDMVQDKQGYFWVATANGLQRFDGERFVSMQDLAGTDARLPASAIQRILPVGNDHLLMTFPDLGEVGVFDKRDYSYQPIRIQSDFSLRGKEFTIWQDKAGNVYLLVYRRAILKYNPIRFAFSAETPFKLPANFAAPLAMFEDTVRRRIYIPTIQKGIYVYDQRKGITYTPETVPKEIAVAWRVKDYPEVADFYIDRHRRHWTFYWGGPQHRVVFDEQGQALRDTMGLSGYPGYHELRHFFESRSGQFWIYGLHGLYRYDPIKQRFQYYDGMQLSAEGIQFKQVYRIQEDRDGTIWFCTNNGLYAASEQRDVYPVVNAPMQLKGRPLDITDVAPAGKDRIWVSSWGDGLLLYDRQMNSLSPSFQSLIPATVKEPVRTMLLQPWAILPVSETELWLGCQGGYLVRFNPVTRAIQHLTDTSLGAATVRYLARSADGALWIGTQHGGLVRYSGGRFERVQTLSNLITRILVTPSGTIWVATAGGGLYVLSADGRKQLKHFTQTNIPTLFSDNGTDLDLLNDSTVAYANGALHFISTRNFEVQSLTSRDGLPGNSLRRIRADRRGNLWLITLNGLSKYHNASRRFIPFGKKDGIFWAHEMLVADAITDDGYLVFSGADMLMAFHPDSYAGSLPPQARVTNVKILSNNLLSAFDYEASPIRMEYNESSVTIYFSSMAYVDREKLAYYYQLSGLSNQWIRADGSSVTFSVLPPGTYRFSVYAENVEGQRSSVSQELVLVIRPPFWRTRWFLSLLGLFLLLVVLLLHRFRVKRLLAVEQVRNRVARDLHDDMGSTLSTINILSAMAKSKISSDVPKATEYLSKITSNSQRMMEAMDDIVWSIKPSNDSMQRIVARMRELASSLLESKDIDVHFEVSEDVPDVRLDMEARRDFFLIFKEAINNAAKYSHATTVQVRIYRDGQRLHLQVEDNGRGFEPELADSGNGLNNMQRRAANMKARFSLRSKPGEGTLIHLHVFI